MEMKKLTPKQLFDEAVKDNILKDKEIKEKAENQRISYQVWLRDYLEIEDWIIY